MTPDKSLGQHWLHDEIALEAMVAAGEVKPNDSVLEIGPGLGTLTEKLIDAGAKVIAVEFDRELYKSLQAAKSASLRDDEKRLQLYNDDILQFDLAQLPAEYKVVANIPYYITAKIIQKFMTAQHKPTQLALLVQKEVAERVAASPGQMSVLSFSVQYYADVELGRVVEAELFDPPPKVDSQILMIKTLAQPRFEADTSKLFRLVKAGFGERRKKLLNSLSGGLAIPKPEVKNLLEAAAIDGFSRAQELSIADWRRLYEVWQDSK